jgi:IS5 family transposase
VNRVIDWSPIKRFLKKKLRRNQDAVGKPAFPALSMFKMLLLQRWWNLSDREMEAELIDRISFVRFTGLSLD